MFGITFTQVLVEAPLRWQLCKPRLFDFVIPNDSEESSACSQSSSRAG